MISLDRRDLLIYANELRRLKQIEKMALNQTQLDAARQRLRELYQPLGTNDRLAVITMAIQESVRISFQPFMGQEHTALDNAVVAFISESNKLLDELRS